MAETPWLSIELARKRIGEGERKSESPYVHRAVLIDTDRLGQAHLRDAQISPIAQAARNCSRQPPQQALTELRRRWPEYVKGIPALRLADQIDDEAILRARAVEAELAGFLADIGYTDGA